MMNRPIPIYLITVWFFIYFATLPQRYPSFVTSIIGVENFRMFTIAFILGMFVIGFKFFKCEKFYINMVIFLFSAHTLYVLGQAVWIAIQHWDRMVFNNVVGAGFIAVNIACIVYLLLPSNRAQIAKTRANIVAELNRKFQLKQLYKK